MVFGFHKKKDRGVTFSLSRFRPLGMTFSLSIDNFDCSFVIAVKCHALRGLKYKVCVPNI